MPTVPISPTPLPAIPPASTPLAAMVLALLLLVGPAQARTESIDAAGAGERAWVVHTVRTDDALISWVHFKADDKSKWAPLARVADGVRDAAAIGPELGLVLGRGDWRVYWTKDWRHGTPLPDRGSMLALAADGKRVFAVVRRGSPPTTTTAPSTQAVEAPATAPATDMPSVGLYVLDGPTWTILAPPPDGVDLATAELSLAVANSQPVLAVRQGAALRAWVLVHDAWGELTVPAGEVRAFRALDGAKPRLWAAGPSGAGHVVVYDGDTPRVIPLEAPGDTVPATPRTVATFGTTLHLIYHQGDQLTLQPYDDAGKPAGPAVSLAAPQAPADPRVGQWIEAALIAAMVFVLVSTIRQRRLEPPSVSGLQGLQLARLKLRFFAGMVDLWPVWVASGLVTYWGYQSGSTFDALLLESRTQLLLLLASVAYVLHTITLEMLTGRSLGKMVFGLRVTDYSGARPTRTAIAIRNLLRILDVYVVFPLPLLLVLYTPLRQRMGDLAARTIVVERQVAAPDTTPGDTPA